MGVRKFHQPFNSEHCFTPCGSDLALSSSTLNLRSIIIEHTFKVSYSFHFVFGPLFLGEKLKYSSFSHQNYKAGREKKNKLHRACHFSISCFSVHCINIDVTSVD